MNLASVCMNLINLVLNGRKLDIHLVLSHSCFLTRTNVLSGLADRHFEKSSQFYKHNELLITKT